MNWYAIDGKFTLIGKETEQGDKVKIETLRVWAESSDDALRKVRDCYINPVDVFHVVCHPDTPEKRKDYYFICDSAEQADKEAQLLYHLDGRCEINKEILG